MRPSGAQRARRLADAREESNTVRGKLELGAWVGVLNNNKLKDSRLAPHGPSLRLRPDDPIGPISARGYAFSTLFLMNGCHFCHFDIEFLLKGLHF